MKSFKQKLMLFVSLICIILVGLMLVFARFFLEPTYLAMVKGDLARGINAIEAAVERYGLHNETLTDFNDDLKNAVEDVLAEGQCLEFSDSVTKQYVGGAENIANCALHTGHSGGSWMDRFIGSNENNLMVMGLRATTVDEGAITTEVTAPDGKHQYVVGRYLPQHQLCVLLSVSLESIGQAVNVLQRQLTWVGVVLLGISLLMAWIFSNWFTKPITAISAAARQIARGNYDVRLPVTQKDEIGVLTEDFNTMAREVGKADALQKDLIANVSHDLRTPLTLIKGYAETIRDLNGDDKTKRDAQLEIIISESDRLSALVGSVTELSRLDAGTEKFAPITFDISDFCEELSYRYDDVCAKNGYQLRLETPGERLITADPELISRVLHNLVSNAIAHIGEDGVIILRVKDGEKGVVVEVEDHGTGIDKDELPHVFQRYYRARQASGRPGTGLGLSIVRAILITHSFPFGVRSTPGKGSTFWFSAPVSAPVSTSAAVPEQH